jgi:hypothetical protein
LTTVAGVTNVKEIDDVAVAAILAAGILARVFSGTTVVLPADTLALREDAPVYLAGESNDTLRAEARLKIWQGSV